MGVGIKETGQHGFTLQIKGSCLITGKGKHVGVASDRNDSVPRYGERFGSPKVTVNRPHVSIDEHRIRCFMFRSKDKGGQ
jgi:hypothetical protein